MKNDICWWENRCKKTIRTERPGDWNIKKNYEKPSKLEIQCKKDVSFHLSLLGIPSSMIKSVKNWGCMRIPNRKIWDVNFFPSFSRRRIYQKPMKIWIFQKDKNQVIRLCFTWNKNVIKIQSFHYPGNH